MWAERAERAERAEAAPGSGRRWQWGPGRAIVTERGPRQGHGKRRGQHAQLRGNNQAHARNMPHTLQPAVGWNKTTQGRGATTQEAHVGGALCGHGVAGHGCRCPSRGEAAGGQRRRQSPALCAHKCLFCYCSFLSRLSLFVRVECRGKRAADVHTGFLEGERTLVRAAWPLEVLRGLRRCVGRSESDASPMPGTGWRAAEKREREGGREPVRVVFHRLFNTHC